MSSLCTIEGIGVLSISILYRLYKNILLYYIHYLPIHAIRLWVHLASASLTYQLTNSSWL